MNRPVVLPPDGATVLIFGDAGCVPTLMGPRTVAHYHRGEGGPSFSEIRIPPGAASSLLGMSMAGLADRAAPIGDRAGSILGRLAETSRSSRDQLVFEAVRLLSADGTGRKRVATVARTLGVSDRYLHSAFTELVGVSPKEYARIDRMRRVLRRVGQIPFAELAIDAGYYDQSHMSAEFRRMMGVPPGAFLAGRYPATCA